MGTITIDHDVEQWDLDVGNATVSARSLLHGFRWNFARDKIEKALIALDKVAITAVFMTPRCSCVRVGRLSCSGKFNPSQVMEYRAVRMGSKLWQTRRLS